MDSETPTPAKKATPTKGAARPADDTPQLDVAKLREQAEALELENRVLKLQEENRVLRKRAEARAERGTAETREF